MISSIGGSTPPYVPMTDPGDPPDPDSDAGALTADALSSFCDNALSDIDAQISTLMARRRAATTRRP